MEKRTVRLDFRLPSRDLAVLGKQRRWIKDLFAWRLHEFVVFVRAEIGGSESHYLGMERWDPVATASTDPGDNALSKKA